MEQLNVSLRGISITGSADKNAGCWKGGQGRRPRGHPRACAYSTPNIRPAGARAPQGTLGPCLEAFLVVPTSGEGAVGL